MVARISLNCTVRMSTSNGAAPNGDSKERATPSVIYDVQTEFSNMDIKMLVGSSAVVYFIEMLLTHPLDVIRTQIQTSQTTSSIEILRTNLRQGGFKSLYAGFLPASIGHLPGNTIYLLAYTYLKDLLQKKENARHPDKIPDGRQAPWVSFTAAMGADVAAVGFYAPVDVVVQRLFLQSTTGHRYSGYREVVTSILKSEGWRGFYRGIGPILVNSVPASAVWWTIYEECKSRFSEKIDDISGSSETKAEKTKTKLVELKETKDAISKAKTAEEAQIAEYSGEGETLEMIQKPQVVQKNTLANIVAGAIAGAVVTFITNPLDVVRTRLQTQSMQAESYQYKNSFHTIKEMWRAEGFRAFFKGTTPRLSQWIIFSAAGAFAYELVVDVSTIKK